MNNKTINPAANLFLENQIYTYVIFLLILV